MAGALDEQDVPVREGRVRVADARAQVLDDLARDVRLREPARDVDRAHRRELVGQAEDHLHEDGVLVGGDPVLDDGPLADGLHEAWRQALPEEAVEAAERGRGLAAVLAGRGEVDLPHRAGTLNDLPALALRGPRRRSC